MDRIEVTSTAAKSLGYDESTQTLEVEFHSKAPDSAGDLWQYSPVPRELFWAMRDGRESIGRRVGLLRRDPEITGRRIDAAEPE